MERNKSNVCDFTPQTVPKIPWFLTLKLYLIGSLIVLPWNLMVNTLPSIRDILVQEPGKTGVLSTVALTTSFNCTLLLTSLLLIFLRHRGFILIYISTLTCLTLALTFLNCAVFLRGSINVVLSLILACMGFCAAFMSNNIMSFCAQLEMYAPGASDAAQGGIGFSGIFSFLVWLLLTRVIFGQYEKIFNIKYSFIGLGVTVTFVVGLSVFALRSISNDKRTRNMRENAARKDDAVTQDESGRIESFAEHIIETTTTTPIEMSGFKIDPSSSFSDANILNEKQPSIRGDTTIVKQASFPYGSFVIPLQTTKQEAATIETQEFSKMKLLAAIYQPVTHIFVTTLITCTLFPNLTPLKWTDLSTSNQDIGVGMYQAGTFIGRGLPVVLTSIHKLPRWMLLVCVWGRIIFFLIYYFVSLHTVVKFLYVLILAITNGVICSMESFYAVRATAPLGVVSQCKAAGWCISGISGGVAVGSLIALLLVQL